jgi:hypothetical protein
MLYGKNWVLNVVEIMARSKNQVATATLTLSTTPLVVGYLQDLVKTGFYGKNHTEAAERLLAATLESMVREGRLKARRTQ